MDKTLADEFAAMLGIDQKPGSIEVPSQKGELSDVFHVSSSEINVAFESGQEILADYDDGGDPLAEYGKGSTPPAQAGAERKSTGFGRTR